MIDHAAVVSMSMISLARILILSFAELEVMVPDPLSSYLGRAKGFLDLLDDVFWMLPFNSDRQAKRVRKDFSLTEDMCNARRKISRGEYRAEGARTELAEAWKQRLKSKGDGAAAAPAAGAAVAVADGEFVYEEE